MNGIERLVRFQRPERSLPYLAGADDARIAAVFGLDADAYRGVLADLEEQARAAARSLLARPEFAEAVDRVPFEGVVVAVGESTTADRLSWFEILRHVLALRGSDSAMLVNLAVSGHTTSQSLTQLPALAFQRPDLVLCMTGANDAQRLRADGPTLVSIEETTRNLAALRDLAGVARWTWLTPSTVDERRIGEFVHFRRAGISWTTEDIDAVAEAMHRRPEPTVDTRAATTGADHHLDDGVHLSVEGQSAVLTTLVHALAETPPTPRA